MMEQTTHAGKERTAIYPGSFDPITVGHLDMIRRACTMFDRVIVAVLHNPAKKGCFPVEQRLEMIRRCCADLPQVSVETFDGLTVECARRAGACAMIRGLRGAADLEQELVLAQINQRLMPQVETVFLACRPEQSIVSSSAVREMAMFGASFSGFVPACIEADVLAHFARDEQ